MVQVQRLINLWLIDAPLSAPAKTVPCNPIATLRSTLTAPSFVGNTLFASNAYALAARSEGVGVCGACVDRVDHVGQLLRCD